VSAAQEAYPQAAEPGAWWMPASLGGGAPTPEQAAALDEADRLRRRAS